MPAERQIGFLRKMKQATVATVAALMCLAFADAADRLPGRLRKAFEALEIYNYFAAKEGFYKTLDKYPAGAGYGLSVIYGRDDNPFTDLDSALKYMRKADAAYAEAADKLRRDYAEVGVDSIALSRQRQHVDSLALLRALHDGSIAALEAFIEAHDTERFRDRAAAERDALAFEKAEQKGTAAAMKAFLDLYPEADQAGKARDIYDRLLFQEQTAGGTPEDYRDFVRRYPESPFRSEAESEAYRLSVLEGTPSAYRNFITDHPDNRYTDDAWRKLYILESGDNSPRAIAAFSLKYPDYPFFDELRSDFDLAVTAFYPVRNDGKWGFCDAEGRVRVPYTFEWTENYSEELALAGLDDEAVYIDKRGRLLTELRFDDGLPFSGGFAVVDVDGKQGVINRLGQWHIPPGHTVLGPYSEGFFYVETEGRFGYLDRNGDMAIPPRFEAATDFYRGRAQVRLEGKCGFIDTLGQAVTALAYDFCEPFGENGLSRVRAGGKWGLVSLTGDTVAPFVFDALGEFSEGRCLAAADGNYGFIGTRGDTLIPFKYAYTDEAAAQSIFSNGRARVFQKIGREVKAGVIDTTDSKVMPAIFSGIGIPDTLLTAVRKKDLWGYADSAVNLAIPYIYDFAGPFRDSLAVVSKGGKYGIINTANDAVTEFKYAALERLDTLFIATDTLSGIIDGRGQELLPMLYADIERIDDQVVRITDPEGLLAYFDYRRSRLIWREAED